MKKIAIFLVLNFVLSSISMVLLPPFETSTDDSEMMIRVVMMIDGKNTLDEDLLDRSDVTILEHYSSINGYSALMSQEAIEIFETISYISISEDEEFVDPSMQDRLDWGVDNTQAERVWGGNEDSADVQLGAYTGKGVKVCIADTGIDYNHPDLNDNYAGGWSFVWGNAYPFDLNGHGTHCAGIIGAEDNGVGVIGVAPEASLYALQIFDLFGSVSIGRLVAAINWAVENDMDILSLSLGKGVSYSSLRTACNNAWDAGLIITSAAGNSYMPWLVYPAAYESTIAVGSVDSNNKKAASSSYGCGLDVVAPGVKIYSTFTRWLSSYYTLSGTSMATPMVAGVCALILSANPNLTNDEVREILHDTATDLGPKGQDFFYGYGLVNAELAVEKALEMA